MKSFFLPGKAMLNTHINVKCIKDIFKKKAKAVPLHTTEVLGGRGGIAPTHS
jgi:hypothetical protein